MSIAAMKMALDALEHLASHHSKQITGHMNIYEAIAALRTAIEEAERAKQIADGFRPLAESCKRTKFRRDIKTAVDRFLCWKLPKDFAPDCGISFIENRSPHCWPVGTNLLTAEQAKEMFEHCLEGTGYVAYPQEAERAEPVAETVTNDGCAYVYENYQDLPVQTPLYTHPAPVPEGMALDAERYRWLRDKRSVTIDTMLHGNGCRARSVDELDAAIDAAMKEPT